MPRSVAACILHSNPHKRRGTHLSRHSEAATDDRPSQPASHSVAPNGQFETMMTSLKHRIINHPAEYPDPTMMIIDGLPQRIEPSNGWQTEREPRYRYELYSSFFTLDDLLATQPLRAQDNTEWAQERDADSDLPAQSPLGITRVNVMILMNEVSKKKGIPAYVRLNKLLSATPSGSKETSYTAKSTKTGHGAFSTTPMCTRTA